MAFSFSKKLKRILMETDSDNETEAHFSRFMIIESMETPITNLSPFVIEKVISSNIKPITVKKKIKNQNLLVEKRNHADFLLKMTRFQNITVKTYPYKSLNISKEVARSKELSLCTIEEIKRDEKTRCKRSEESVYQKRGENNQKEHLHNDIRPGQNTKEYKSSRLFNGEGQAIRTQSIAMLQLSEIRPS